MEAAPKAAVVSSRRRPSSHSQQPPGAAPRVRHRGAHAALPALGRHRRVRELDRPGRSRVPRLRAHRRRAPRLAPRPAGEGIAPGRPAARGNWRGGLCRARPVGGACGGKLPGAGRARSLPARGARALRAGAGVARVGLGRDSRVGRSGCRSLDRGGRSPFSGSPRYGSPRCSRFSRSSCLPARTRPSSSLEFLPAVLIAGWMGVVAFALLKDHAAAWVFFGAIAFGGARTASMLAQPAASDQMAGWVGVALIVLAVAGLLLKLRVRAREMGLDGVHGDEQRLRDLLVGQALGGEVDDAPLGRRQLPGRARAAGADARELGPCASAQPAEPERVERAAARLERGARGAPLA